MERWVGLARNLNRKKEEEEEENDQESSNFLLYFSKATWCLFQSLCKLGFFAPWAHGCPQPRLYNVFHFTHHTEISILILNSQGRETVIGFNSCQAFTLGPVNCARNGGMGLCALCSKDWKCLLQYRGLSPNSPRKQSLWEGFACRWFGWEEMLRNERGGLGRVK